MHIANDPQAEATIVGIQQSDSGIPAKRKEAALAFFETFAKKHLYFTGGDVLAAWRETGDSIANSDWRNGWGAICRTAQRRSWVVKAGRRAPTSRQSHTGTLALWESQLCKLTAAKPVGHDVHSEKIDQLTQAVADGCMSVNKALWQAHDIGADR